MRSELFLEMVRLGVRNISRNRRRSLITGAMISLAVAGIVFFEGYGLGIERVLVNMAVEGLVGALQVQRVGYLESQDLGPLDLDLPVDDALVKRLEQVPNVQAVAPRLVFTGMLSTGEASAMVFALGIDPRRESSVCPSGPGSNADMTVGFNKLVAGSTLSDPDEESVVLTDVLATSLGVKVGDSVVLLVRSQSGSMDTVDLTIRGLFHYDDPNGSRQFGVVPLGVAQRLLHMEHRATSFGVSVIDRQRLDTTAVALRAAVNEVHPSATVHTWSTLAPYYRDVADLQNGMLQIVFLVVLAIVLAGIANTMVMSTFERKREIGALMAMGFRRKALITLFLVEALWLGLIGATVGAVLGVALIQIAYTVGIPFSVPAGGLVITRPELLGSHVAFAMVGALVSAVLAAILPAYRASRLNPIEALRAD